MPNDWDVFVSYASEDREPFVRDLVGSLRAAALRVWYDQLELQLGQSLREAIEDGIARSRFAVVVVSEHYFSKLWTRRELDALLATESGNSKILPLWHKVSQRDVAQYSAIVASRVAVRTDSGLDVVVSAIRERVEPETVSCIDLHEGGATVSVMLHYGVVLIDGSFGQPGRHLSKMFEFSGRELNHRFEKLFPFDKNMEARRFEFEGRTALVRTNKGLVTPQQIEEGVILNVRDDAEPLWCAVVRSSLCTSRLHLVYR